MATKTDTDKYALAIANRVIEPISVGLNINISIKPKNRIFFKFNFSKKAKCFSFIDKINSVIFF